MEVAVVKLRETRGEFAPMMAAILMVGVLLLSTALEVHHVYAVVDRVAGIADEAVLAAAADNVEEIYSGVRESAWASRQYQDNAWACQISTSAVEEALIDSLGAVSDGAGLRVGDSVRITALETQAENPEDGNLNFTTTLTLEIPLSLGGDLLPPIHKTLEVKTTYEPRF
ncbi:MAG: hypothetical protein VB071_12295 [Lawsonibacter sp.]|nr:hypothetical protein [Lawsonibacter sp.]